MMRVPFVDLRAQTRRLHAELTSAFERVLASGVFVLGDEVLDFERTMAARIGARHAIGVSSGTDAILAALLALGIGSGDEVVTTPFSFIATAESVRRVGAEIRFADVERTTLNVDAAKIEDAMTPRTRAILVVHLYGRPASLDLLSEIAARRGVPLVEDAAQAYGSTFGGRSVGSWGRIGCFSFFPTKLLGAMGDAGLVVTDDDDLAARVRRLRQHGRNGEGIYAEVGGNFRIDALQAAVLSAKVGHVDEWMSLRRAHAAAYDEAFRELPSVELLRHPPQTSWNAMIYTVRVPASHREAFRRHLAENGIETRVYYDPPLHLQRALKRVPTQSLPESEAAARAVVSLPLYAELECAQREAVVEAVRGFFGS